MQKQNPTKPTTSRIKDSARPTSEYASSIQRELKKLEEGAVTHRREEQQKLLLHEAQLAGDEVTIKVIHNKI